MGMAIAVFAGVDYCGAAGCMGKARAFERRSGWFRGCGRVVERRADIDKEPLFAIAVLA